MFEVEGTPKLNPQAPGGVELVDPSFRLRNAAPEPPPVNLRVPELKEQLPYQLDHGAIALRHPKRRAVFRLGALSLAGMRATLDAAGFVEIQTPKIVASATETGANVFRIDYFGRPGYLAQSPQFYKQMMVGVFERVYEIGPVFRAEPHDTVRHLAEYVSLDVELGFIDDHFSVMAVLRDVIAGMVGSMQEQGAAGARAARPQAPERAGRDPAPRLRRSAGAHRTRDGGEGGRRRAGPRARARTLPRGVGDARARLRLRVRRRLPDGRSGRSTRTRTPSGRSTRTAST